MPYHIFDDDIKYFRYATIIAIILFGFTLIFWFYDGANDFNLLLAGAGALLSAISMKKSVKAIRKRKERFEKVMEKHKKIKSLEKNKNPNKYGS